MNSLRLLLRFAIVGGLILLLLVPLLMIRGVILDRQMYRSEAASRVAASRAGEQTFTGPVRILPWTETAEVEVTDGNGRPRREMKTTKGQMLQMPARLQVDGRLQPDTRRIGLFEVPVYSWQGRTSAAFAAYDAPAVKGRVYGEPYLALGITDVRGLVGTPNLRVDGRALSLEAGSGALSGSSDGLHAALPTTDTTEAGAMQLPALRSVELELVLDGTTALSVVPIGDDTRIALQSTWQHPSFSGSFLPNERQIGEEGFQAQWAISSLASNAQEMLRRDITSDAVLQTVRVDLVDPVDVYTQADRASKYGILFIVLTFVGFLLFELVRHLRIHPLQYLLVGLALAIFFLLLLVLSERIPFWQAYIASAVACIGLQAVYLSGVLRSWKRGAGFAFMLTVLYGALYGLLASENNALLMGALLLFAVLTAVMLLTRRIDWYALSGSTAPADTSGSSAATSTGSVAPPPVPQEA